MPAGSDERTGRRTAAPPCGAPRRRRPRRLCFCTQAEAHARKLLTTTNLSAVLRPQHVVTIKDSASVDQTLRVSR